MDLEPGNFYAVVNVYGKHQQVLMFQQLKLVGLFFKVQRLGQIDFENGLRTVYS